MNITFFGGANQVTGSCYLLETCNKRILIDCGLEQDKQVDVEILKKKIESIPSVDVCFITHAHIDHTGLLPFLVKKKKVNKIYSTSATRELSKLLLEDNMKLQALNSNGDSNILYNENDLINTMLLWEIRDENNIIKINGDIEVVFLYNAHIIGSVSVYIKTTEGNFLFTGDIGTKQQKLMSSKIDIPDDVDYLVMETTYGNKIHNSTDRERLHGIIDKICRNGGKVLIPVFAVGRLQEILFELTKNNLPYKVYVDTPLGSKVTVLTDDYKFYLSRSLRKLNDEIIFGDYIPINTSNQSRSLAESDEPCVILSASGMLEGGRVLNHLESIKNDPKSALVFVGYQAEGTRGRRIYDGEEVVLCQIERLSAFSAHADRSEIFEYFNQLPVLPYKTYLVHGESEQRKEIYKDLKRRKIRVEMPNNFDNFRCNSFIEDKHFVINIPLDFFTLSSYRIAPCLGYIVDKGDSYEIVSREWYDNLYNEQVSKIMEIVKEKQESELNTDIEDETIPSMDIETVRNNIRVLTEVKVYTKTRKKDFWEELIKGKKALLKYIEDIHRKNPNTGKRRWSPPQVGDKFLENSEAEEYYELAYSTGKALLNFEKSVVYKLLME